jgi:DNA-binding transcriptional LysR family regulator
MNARFDLRQLRYFVTVADELSFRRAAERLHISQPPLSRQIRSLESRLGLRLLERDTRTVKLTSAGEAALRRARRILADVEAFGTELASCQEATVVRVGATIAISVGAHRRLEAAWQAKVGNRSRVCLEIAKTSVLIARLRRRELDFALIGMHPPVEGFERLAVHQIPLVAAMYPTHPAARKKVVCLRDIGDGTIFWLRRSYNPDYYDHCQKIFARSGFSPRFIHVDPGQLSTLARVAHGEGCTLVRPSQVEMVKGLVYRPLKEGRALAIVIEAIWQRGGSDPERARRDRLLREAAQAVLQECEYPE